MVLDREIVEGQQHEVVGDLGGRLRIRRKLACELGRGVDRRGARFGGVDLCERGLCVAVQPFGQPVATAC